MRVVGPKSRYAHQVEDSFMAQLRLSSGPTSSGRNTKKQNETKQNETPEFLSKLQRDLIIRWKAIVSCK